MSEQKPKWIEVAEKELGVHETPGARTSSRIVEYAMCTSLGARSDEVPWCASFVNWCLKQAGMQGTGLANASSFLTYGEQLKTAVEGCIAVFDHHVAFVHKIEDDILVCLGGNQDDQVKDSRYKREKALSYRWPVPKSE